ncbi:hypothetical protein C0992_000781 [Termitomyces sp. T32_za158]|nr:hypothetical protein C0992_000781 [Termitomyces sp. T32_za158]
MSASNDKNSSGSHVPDPEDNFDDFDDVLEQFNQPRPSAAKPPPASTIPEPPRASTSADVVPESDLMSDDFAKELANGMADLMREIAGSGSQPSNEEKGKDQGENLEISDEQRRALKAAWEAMLVDELGESGDEDKSKDGGKFQETIKKAMDKLKESENDVQSSTSKPGSGGSEDELAELLAKLGKEGGSDEDMTSFLENMMGQLMSKEILYEPLKELSDSVRSSTSSIVLARYLILRTVPSIPR